MVITLTLIYMSINYLRTIFARISGQTLFLICSKDRPKSVRNALTSKGFFSHVKENYFLWVSVLNQQAKLHAHKWP